MRAIPKNKKVQGKADFMPKKAIVKKKIKKAPVWILVESSKGVQLEWRKKTVKALSVLLALMLLLVSCAENSIENPSADLVEAGFSVSSEKYLTAEIDTQTVEYRYTATPLFTLENPNQIYGAVEKEKSLGGNGEKSLGLFTSGKWRFHLYAYNISGNLIREGETELYLKRGEKGLYNSIPITLTQSTSRKGSVHFAFEVNMTSKDASYVELSYSANNGSYCDPVKFYPSESSFETNISKYDFTLTDLQAGTYVFVVNLYDSKILIGGSAVSTYILDKATTEISGTVYPSEYLLASFSIEIPPAITGSIGSQINGQVGSEYTFVWRPISGEPYKYVWRKDGTIVKEGKENTWIWTPDAPGCYTISCTALSETGLEAGSSSCLLNIQSGRREVYKASWEAPTGTKTLSYSGEITPSSLLRLHVDDGLKTIVTTYLNLVKESGVYKSSITLSGGQVLAFSLSNGTLSMNITGSLTGLVVELEVSP